MVKRSTRHLWFDDTEYKSMSNMNIQIPIQNSETCTLTVYTVFSIQIRWTSDYVWQEKGDKYILNYDKEILLIYHKLVQLFMWFS